MRKEFVMTEKQCKKILDACKPVPYMIFGGREPISQQENTNAAWYQLGNELGFKGMTVEPVSGKSMVHFTAEVKEEI